MDLVLKIYTLCKLFPPEELYGLSSQMKRSSISIVSNIAEGSRRGTEKDKRHFLTISFGSASELETQLEIARKLLFITEAQYRETNCLLIEVLKMLHSLSKVRR